jgi:hypothetical protein
MNKKLLDGHAVARTQLHGAQIAIANLFAMSPAALLCTRSEMPHLRMMSAGPPDLRTREGREHRNMGRNNCFVVHDGKGVFISKRPHSFKLDTPRSPHLVSMGPYFF